MNLSELPGNVVLQVSKKDLLEVIQQALEFKEPTIEKKWFTLKELCKYTGYKAATIYRLVKLRKIPFAKNSGKLLFEKERIDAWMRTNQNE